MDALVNEESDFIVNPGGDEEPVKCMKNGGYVFILADSHQDPSSTVLNVLDSCW